MPCQKTVVMADSIKKLKSLYLANLTPVTIMVVNTISAVRSRKLLRVLLDSGSTTTLINKNAYPYIVSHAKFLVVEK